MIHAIQKMFLKFFGRLRYCMCDAPSPENFARAVTRPTKNENLEKNGDLKKLRTKNKLGCAHTEQSG